MKQDKQKTDSLKLFAIAFIAIFALIAWVLIDKYVRGMILIMTLLTLLNLASSIWNYNLKNYKTAMFSSMVTGYCLFSLLTNLIL